MGEERSASRGVRLLRALGIVLLAVVVLWLLFTQVFPRVERYLEDPTLDAATAPIPPAVSAGDRG